MKYLPIYLILCISGAYSINRELIEAFMKRAQKYSVQCVIEAKANAGDIAELLQYKEPSRHEGKCLLYCFYRNFNIQRVDGSIDQDRAIMMMGIIKSSDPDIYQDIYKVFTTCLDKVPIDEDPCVTAADFSVCCTIEAKAIGLDKKLMAQLDMHNITISNPYAKKKP